MNSTEDSICIGGDTNLYFWRKNNGPKSPFGKVKVFEFAHSLEVNCVDWSIAPDNIIASVSDDRFCCIWKVHEALF
jgi:WD40 repeat protein